MGIRRAWERFTYAVGVPFAFVLLAIFDAAAYLHRRRVKRGQR